VGGADAIAVRDGGKATHRSAKKSGKSLDFCVAQFREFSRHVGDWAVVLAQLLPSGRAAPAEAA